MPGFISDFLATLAMIGIAYTLAATALAGRWRSGGGGAALPGDAPAVTLLKPLHGAEPGLAERLAGFARQDYPGAIDMACGVTDPADPALAAIPEEAHVTRVSAPPGKGSNRKISNLVNILAESTGDILILSDSDIAVGPDYARRVVAPLLVPGVGAVTLPYAGEGVAGGWSRLAAAGISWRFLPDVTIGVATGLANPCMGSTIAIRRETLDAIGGFAPFRDLLADDHAIGAAVRGLGLRVAVAPPIVSHHCFETSLAALWRQELRWNATVRMVNPAGYAGSIVTHPIPLAILAGIAGAGWWVLGVALLARLALAARIDALTGRRTAPLWWLPGRDLLSFALFLAGLVARSVDWRGSRLHMAQDGRVSAETETRHS